MLVYVLMQQIKRTINMTSINEYHDIITRFIYKICGFLQELHCNNLLLFMNIH